MGMPPVDLASGDKHALVRPAAARRQAVAPPSAIGLEAPVVLASARSDRDADAAGTRHRHAQAVIDGERRGAGARSDAGRRSAGYENPAANQALDDP
jgi:hypothetical protein